VSANMQNALLLYHLQFELGSAALPANALNVEGARTTDYRE
jgi:hypothetical protein